MAFLDNSGDIILDAVLTDTGRMRLARGDGSFQISKFAFGDDEVNYALYDKNDVSGSAYYDLEILQTPILEAFTNNTSFLKSKLMTIPRTNLLYLPVILANTSLKSNLNFNSEEGGAIYVVTADTTTQAASTNIDNVMDGIPGAGISTRPIGLEQGLQTTEIPPSFTLDPDLVENQYIVEVDNRICQLADSSKNIAPVSFIDDDNIASYFISRGAGAGAFIANGQGQNSDQESDNAKTPITGPRGTSFKFTLRSSIQLQTSTYLFTKLGSTKTSGGLTGFLGDYYFIDTNIRITGGQTGYRTDIPVRFVKKV
jgi:hypothetical protein|tara:strand:+ start:211 stop:1146 length:936 start_codon:yes stop_codon:yes gene_type:complete